MMPRSAAVLMVEALVVSVIGCASHGAHTPEWAAGKRLQSAIDAAEPSAVVSVAPGKYAAPLRITKPLTLRGDSRDHCIIEVQANEPAIYVSGRAKAVLENLTVRWAIASRRAKPKMPAAIGVEDADADVRMCRIAPIRAHQTPPCALLAKGASSVRVQSSECEGFEFTVMFVDGAGGEVSDSVFRNAGHCAITLHRRSKVKITRNIVTGSRYHGVRSSGGFLELTDNILAGNRRSGAYLGNKNAHGTIRNNLFVGNCEGISSFYRSDVAIERNLFVRSKYAGVGTWDSCPLVIRRNSFVANGSAIKRYVGKCKLSPLPVKLEGNHYWQNAKDTVECEKSDTARAGDPLFAAADKNDFALQAGSPLLDEGGRPLAGLADAEAIRVLAEKWEQAPR